MNVKYPIVITDTPGLNGIADKHREISLDEIKKAHACIYLLSGNGVKSTDFDFIKILLNYQRKFIFIQNFIDLLRESEGETVQSKITTDKENLKICFGEDNSEISYQVCGVSAVKALASRDLSKDRVFEEDMESIADREKLFEESNFAEFEKCLYKIIESGEYLKVIEDSVAYTLVQIIERIKNNLDEECELNEQLKAKDDKSMHIEKAQKIITRIDSQKEEQKKRLENFLISRDSENRHSLYEYTKRCLEELLDSINKDLDEKVKVYEELVTFADYYGAQPPRYYGRYISNHVNGKLVPDIDSRIQDNLGHLYDEAILRVSNFVTIVLKTKENISIEVSHSIPEFSERDIQSNFERYKMEAQKKRADIEQMKASNKDMNEEKVNVERKINSERQKSNMERLQYEREKQKIGTDPGVKQRMVEKTRTVSRTGLFAGFRDMLFGEKTETYWEYEPDYSEQNAWKKRKAEIEERNRRTQDLHSKHMSVLEAEKRKIQDEISTNSKTMERLQKDILDIEKRAKREQEIYERTLKVNKQEYCSNEKRKLKEVFSMVLLGAKDQTSALDRLNKHIDEIDLKYLPKIQEKVLKYYTDSITSRTESLNELIRCNEKELEAKYELSKKELTILDEVLEYL